jgi:transcription initiation factor IIF auxiliary subunit
MPIRERVAIREKPFKVEISIKKGAGDFSIEIRLCWLGGRKVTGLTYRNRQAQSEAQDK